ASAGRQGTAALRCRAAGAIGERHGRRTRPGRHHTPGRPARHTDGAGGASLTRPYGNGLTEGVDTSTERIRGMHGPGGFRKSLHDQ
ncbi:hypothetical protein NGM37_22185, partial [Streptomyces sp. TRM76130]|nr:hypothetical protein [Streptomyces sp. TRM76130]